MIETVSTPELAPQDTNWEDYCWVCPDMAFVKPLFPIVRVDAAGETLINQNATATERDDAEVVVNNWRSSHAYPLQVIKMTLRTRARSVDSHSLVVQRLKRLPAIKDKLSRPFRNLSKMNDVGGCRAIVFSPGQLTKLYKKYLDSDAKNPKDRPQLISKGKYDYITSPKNDGYRGIHLVLKYRTSTEEYKEFIGHRIEIQLRTQLQHAWATAVETVSVFTLQNLKSGEGDERWKRFFALMGTAIAQKEKLPIVPGTPEDHANLVAELKDLARELRVIDLLRGWHAATKRREVQKEVAHTYLLVLNVRQQTFEYLPFREHELALANETYENYEKEHRGDPLIQSVLVSGDSWKELEKAYPNFSVDTEVFVRLVRDEVEDEVTRTQK